MYMYAECEGVGECDCVYLCVCLCVCAYVCVCAHAHKHMCLSKMCALLILFLSSNLKALLEPFNELADKLVDKLKTLADGKMSVPMRLQFGEFTLNVISKVHVYNI